MSNIKNSLLIILLITISMNKFKNAKGRVYDGKQKNYREINKLNYQNLQTRHHNHYLHKKHHKCNYERSYYDPGGAKKLSRYPTLDKIVYRLDNGGDRPKVTKPSVATSTISPFDEWGATSFGTTPFPENSSGLYVHNTYGGRNGTHKVQDFRNEGHFEPKKNPPGIDFRTRTIIPFKGKDNTHDNSINEHFRVVSTGFMQDHTTSSPWENEQHDISSRAEEILRDSKYSSTLFSTPTPLISKNFNLEKLPFWSISKLVSKSNNGDDRKKDTTSEPYVAAHEHYEQILRMGDCHIPKEKVIRVHEVHPNPSKSYSPSCTILHQCADDTGCCRDLKQVCKPKNTTKVELYFFTTTLGKPQTVEKLHFVNHTECECQKRTDESMPQDAQFQQNYGENGEKVNLEGSKKVKCYCPEKYSVRFFHNESCICDCFDKQDECLVLKKGKAHFSHRDKLCISQGTCRSPSCEYGFYIRRFGRCPNRSEKYNFRWNRIFSFRDLIT